jgi:tetratricopeptide (TPR) repeat protein
MGDYNGAISDFTKVIELDPKYFDIYQDLGVARYCAGFYLEALADFQKGCEGEYPWTNRLLAWITRSRLGQREAATQDLANQLKESKRADTKSRSFIIAEYLVGEHPESLLLSGDPGHWDKKAMRHSEHFFVGMKYLIEGNRSQARSHLRKSLEANLSVTSWECDIAVAELKMLGE